MKLVIVLQHFGLCLMLNITYEEATSKLYMADLYRYIHVLLLIYGCSTLFLLF